MRRQRLILLSLAVLSLLAVVGYLRSRTAAPESTLQRGFESLLRGDFDQMREVSLSGEIEGYGVTEAQFIQIKDAMLQPYGLTGEVLSIKPEVVGQIDAPRNEFEKNMEREILARRETRKTFFVELGTQKGQSLTVPCNVVMQNGRWAVSPFEMISTISFSSMPELYERDQAWIAAFRKAGVNNMRLADGRMKSIEQMEARLQHSNVR